MKKSSPKLPKKTANDKPFTTAEAVQFFGGIREHFDDKFKVIHERIDGMDEKFERKFDEVNGKLDEHTQILGRHELILHDHTRKLHEHSEILGRLLLDTEEIKSGMREKVSVQDFNKLETRLVLLESIVFTGGNKKGKVKAKSGK